MFPIIQFRNAAVAAVIALMPFQANATEILFAHVGTGYDAEGAELAGFVSGISGFNVTSRYLDSAVYNDFDSFDQIWVYDLSPAADNNPFQMANYAAIAQWYQDKGQPNVIADGRIVASSSTFTNLATGTGQSEAAWIQNYAIQLDLRGGGLVLGTDHATAFTQGINFINQAIQISPFASFYYQSPYEAVVNPSSELFIGGLANCDPVALAGAGQCLNDNSSGSLTPTNLQPNGDIFYPVAYHNGSLINVAISTTINGPAPQPPEPDSAFEPGSLALLGIGLFAFTARRKRRA